MPGPKRDLSNGKNTIMNRVDAARLKYGDKFVSKEMPTHARLRDLRSQQESEAHPLSGHENESSDRN